MDHSRVSPLQLLYPLNMNNSKASRRRRLSCRRRRGQPFLRCSVTTWAATVVAAMSVASSSAYQPPAFGVYLNPQYYNHHSRDAPTMFVDQLPTTLTTATTSSNGGILVSSPSPASAAATKRTNPLAFRPLDKNGAHQQQHRRNRGVLGIHISWNEVNTKQQQEQSPASLSSVDSSSWNLQQEPLSLDASAAYGKSNSGSGCSGSGSSSSSNSSSAATQQIPWIPSPEQIQSLTVVQLKVELGARALKKAGCKRELQERLQEWTKDQGERLQKRRNPNKKNGSSFEHELESWDIGSLSFLKHDEQEEPKKQQPKKLEANSLAEWSRTVDLEPLLQRREAIHREKLEGKKHPTESNKVQKASNKPQTPAVLPSDYLSVLNKVFDKPSSPYSNREVKQMYAAAKLADQAGDRTLSKQLLLALKSATPHDARIYRRLSRMEREDGNVDAARLALLEGLELHPDNAFLWHGLGHLEGTVGNEALQNQHWLKAIAVDPLLPHSYHALGTLHHTKGHVAQAMKILKAGVDACPTNHRLHHALGDLYRDAKMLDRAQKCYRKALLHGPFCSHGFAYTALAYVAYDQGQSGECRRWLHKSVQLNHGRHANGWVALAQFEEAQGNVEAARSACLAGIAQYERGLIERSRNIKFRRKENSELGFLQDPVTIKNSFLKSVPSYRSGDRFFTVYRNWARLEERYGTLDSTEEVYERAQVAFPLEFKLALDAAQYYVKLDLAGRAREMFVLACTRAGAKHADPYRHFAEFEMAHGDFPEARKILYTGAMALSQKGSGGGGGGDARRGTPQLFSTWAVCEWHVGKLSHAERLFDHALEITPVSQTKLRSFILYARARFEYFSGELRRAQHFVGLCLKENQMPGGNAKVWNLWAAIANEMGDERMAQQCQQQAARLYEESEATILSDGVLQPTDVQQSMRRDPWHQQLFGSSSNDKFLHMDLLPEKKVPKRVVWKS